MMVGESVMHHWRWCTMSTKGTLVHSHQGRVFSRSTRNFFNSGKGPNARKKTFFFSRGVPLLDRTIFSFQEVLERNNEISMLDLSIGCPFKFRCSLPDVSHWETCSKASCNVLTDHDCVEYTMNSPQHCKIFISLRRFLIPRLLILASLAKKSYCSVWSA